MTATEELVSALDVLRAIDQLRRDLSGYHGQLKANDDLQRHCDNQRMRIGELERLYAGAKAERDEAWMAYGREYDRANFLVDKNDKLLELVRDMRAVIWAYDEATSDDDCPPALPLFEDRLRDLGIEVEQ